MRARNKNSQVCNCSRIGWFYFYYISHETLMTMLFIFRYFLVLCERKGNTNISEQQKKIFFHYFEKRIRNRTTLMRFQNHVLNFFGKIWMKTSESRVFRHNSVRSKKKTSNGKKPDNYLQLATLNKEAILILIQIIARFQPNVVPL